MISTLFLIGQIGLSIYIIVMLGIVILYFIKNLKPVATKEIAPVKKIFENNLAIIFYDFASEEEILERIQELQNQNYHNFTAYFFIKTPIIETNNLTNIKIIRPFQLTLNGLNFLSLCKQYFIKKPKAIIALRSNASLSKDFLFRMNLNLLKGIEAVQAQVIVDGNNESLESYQKMAREFFNLIDREAPNSLGISAAIWQQGFMLSYSAFNEIDFNRIASNDKYLQAELISKSIKIAYDSTARIFGKPLNETEFKVEKRKGLSQYFYNIKLGFKLLIEGLKKPNCDKIIFGLNYLRPPLYLVLASSFVLLLINLNSFASINLFAFVAFLGIVFCLIFIFKAKKIIQFFNPLKLTIEALKPEKSPYSHNNSFLYSHHPEMKSKP
jgi:hypothetical protein